MGPERQVLAALVASRHYLQGHTKSRIAEDLALSRFQVARLLESAHAEGIVRISVELPSGVDADLSDELRRRFGLQRALAARPGIDAESNRARLGKVAAELLSDLLTEDDYLGITWGRTLSAIPGSLTRLAPCPVVQLTGVTGTITENTVEMVRQICAVSGGPATPIYAPHIVADAATAAGLRRQPTIARALELHAMVTRAVVAVGSWVPPDSQVYSVLPAEERHELVRRGVRADLCGTLLAADGSVIDALADRCVAASTDRLRAIPEVIAVAGGPSKTEAVLAAVRSGLVHGLVTDTAVAQELLAHE